MVVIVIVIATVLLSNAALVAANTAAKKTTAPASNNVNHGEELVQWLRSKERGFFSDKIALDINQDGKSTNGIVAKEYIPQNEVLMVIPNECLLKPSPSASDPYAMCETAKSLVREYLRKDQSNFAPYVRYTMGYLDRENAQDEDRHKIPSAWSQAGKDLIKTIIGRELEPTTIDVNDYWDFCSYLDIDDLVEEEGHNGRDHVKFLLQEAWRVVIPRSWNEVIIPVYDMINHRNGHWHNVDQLTTAHDPDGDVTVVAIRDIMPGEQLYMSYNECRDIDCEGMAHTYVLPQILRDYGFVEQYPRRWWFDFDEDALVFEIDQVPTGKESSISTDQAQLTITWLSTNPPTFYDIHVLRGHLNRQRSLKDFVLKTLEQVPSTSEKEVILEYYQALTTVLEMAIEDADVGYKTSNISNNSNTMLPYDDLEPGTAPNDEESLPLCSSESRSYLGNAPYKRIGRTQSQYQGIVFEHNFDIDDTCLYLSRWLATCTSCRPHYHESLVHIPASFVDDVKRVIFIGGGDNMLLHEILKYPSLELVLGMELDQQVVRSSFKNLGTLPHFDNEKVQWWFGDATKSLPVLLEQGDKYKGTFDLVIVDLQTYVAETLMVTKDMTIMDVAMQLLQPEGIIAWTEDFHPRRSVGFAKFEVDLEVLDVPILNQQSITIGSKNVDFLTKTPKNHKIDTVYLNESDAYDSKDKFARWLNYRNNLDLNDGQACNEREEDEAENEKDDAGGHGVHMIIEVEDALASVKDPENARQRIRKALGDAGLTELSFTASPTDNFVTVYICMEGYVVSQIWSEHQYVALDVKLWSSFESLDKARAHLIAAVSSKEGQSPSSYMLVTGGMYGISQGGSTVPLNNAGTCTEKEALDSVELENIDKGATETIVRTAISQLARPDPAIAVICGDYRSPCGALEALSSQDDSIARNVIPLWACPNLSNTSEMERPEEAWLACQNDSFASLQDSVATSGKIDAIVIDAKAPKTMGQILHLILSDKARRRKLLQKDYIVVTESLQDSSQSSWRRALLERFQTQFDPFSPAQRAQLSFRANTGGLELGVFSSGNPGFYSYLESFLTNIEKQTGLAGEVRMVEDGLINYIPDFKPSVIGSGGNYDHSDSLEQWLSQKHMGHQTIFQFKIKPPQTYLDVGERILVNIDQDVWAGKWFHGQVTETEKDGGVAVVLGDGGNEVVVGRDFVLKYETDSPIEVREHVLIRRYRYWSQGAVIGLQAEEGGFKVRVFDSGGDVLTVQREDLVKRVESSDSDELPSLSPTSVHHAFTAALRHVSAYFDENPKNAVVSSGIGDGCVIAAFFTNGISVASWDGRAHIDVSIFTEKQDVERLDAFSRTFLDELPSLMVATRDELPRGSGRVVNFQSELEDPPHWTDLTLEE